MTPAAGTTRAVGAAGGFTLLELILVILLLALFASVTAPRLVGTQSRRADMEAESVRSLLTTVAHRAATTTEPLALVYDAESATLSAEVRRLRDTASARGQELSWRADALIAPVKLSLTELREAMTATAPLGRRSWRLELPTAEPRPALRLVLGGRADLSERVWTIDLPEGAPAAARREGTGSAGPMMTGAVDLDALGQGNQAW